MREVSRTSNLLSVLLLEQSKLEVAAIRACLGNAGYPLHIADCRSIAEAEALLARGESGFDVLLVGSRLPDGRGIDFCRRHQQSADALPTVFLADAFDQEIALESLRPGANRYVVRDGDGAYLEMLPLLLPEVVNRHWQDRVLEHSRRKLQENESRLWQIINGSSVATFVIDETHVVTHWNVACERLTGTVAAELIGTRNQWRAFYPEMRPVMADLVLDGAIEGEVERYYREKFRRSSLVDGAYEAEDYFPTFGDNGRWLYFTAAPLRDGGGRIIGAIETLQDVTERRRAEAALRESEERYRMLSITDSRTGLFNSRHLYERLETEIERCLRYRHSLSLMVLDIDDFKRVNDTYGHLAGDAVLTELGDVIRACLRRSDSAYRFGGEEFVVMLPETEVVEAERVAERIRESFASVVHEPVPGVRERVSVSIGLTRYRPSEDSKSCIRRADSAMYRAKQAGKNCVVLMVA